MAISLVDTAVPMNDTGYPVARAKHIWFDDNATLQDKLNNKELGGDNSTVLTQTEYEALSEEQKLNGLYYTYDTKRIYKNGVQYGASEPIQLTMEEYKALGEVDPDQEYIISADAEGILLEASDIGYSNAVSNLSCTTVQGAIDKVVETSGNVYSTEETICGTWIDGKPIYRKVLVCTANIILSPNDNWRPVQGWSDPIPNLKKYVKVDFSSISYGSRLDYNISEGAGITFYTLLPSQTIAVGNTLIVEYTKTTD